MLSMGVLCPHHGIKCMPRAEAEEWQRRSFSLSDNARLADRRLLLGLEPDDHAQQRSA
jgi:hypothetical protein